MSNFKFSGNDLDAIFMPISTPGATMAPSSTNFISPTGDLQIKYAAYVSGSLAAPQTHYRSSNYSNLDLNTVFQWISSPIAKYLQTGGSVVEVGSTVTITWSNGIGGTLTLYSSFPISGPAISISSLIGGGSGGSGGLNALSTTQGGAGGNGGRAGQIKISLSLPAIYDTIYTITAGNNGVAGTANGGVGGIGGYSAVTVTTNTQQAFGDFLASGAGGVGGTTTVPGGGFGDSITTSSGAGGGGGALNTVSNAGGSSSGGGDGGGSGGKNNFPDVNGAPPMAGEIGTAIGGGGGGGGGGGVLSSGTLGTGAKGSSGRPGIVVITFTYP
jgi:hypothetical protein